MFFIVNKTNKHITLPDIKISLGPKQAIDLDRIMDRSESEKSRHLRAAKSNGDVEIRVKDTEAVKKIPNTPVRNNGTDIRKMKDEIIKEVKDGIKSLKSINQPKDVLSKEDLLDAMKELIQSMPVREVIIREGSRIDNDEESVEMNENLVAEINARTVEKRVKDVKMESVNYKEESADNTIMGNIDELEGLLE